MAELRFKGLYEIMSRRVPEYEIQETDVTKIYGIHVFDRVKMSKYIPEEEFRQVIIAIDEGKKIDRKIADKVAAGMKLWALEHGATHYTHWFHPLTGATAEKHDTFFEPSQNGVINDNFSGHELVQQEPDASSFPSGGIRNTFEARGYSAWDPSSPAFIVGDTLCIPTIFISYTGEALDYKTPLLKSSHALDKAAVAVCRYFSDKTDKVVANLGWEQEYFLVDEALFMARPDLKMTGRTLLGHASAKDQQLEDHYFGSIPLRVSAFMRDFELESYKLGIPIKTRHNEVAPNQFECAPHFEEVNLATDHNQLLMDIMEKTARRHMFRVLFHEKPYSGINGSGKHCNWSIATNGGLNLLSPGSSPHRNMQFLTFFVNVIKAVHDHSDILMASIMNAGNEHRLGAHEAPPSVISIFIGKKLTQVLDEIENTLAENSVFSGSDLELKLNLIKIPEILLDNTDRNRTSPFAFTGNRFEFRAVGSGANVASAMITLNTIVADQLTEFRKDVEILIEKGEDKNKAIISILKRYIITSKNIRFEGNGYSSEWVEEACRRGLPNLGSAIEALKAFKQDKNISLFEKNQVMGKRELIARYEIQLEDYIKKIQIESRVLNDLAINHIIPTAVKYQNILISNYLGLKEIFSNESDIYTCQLNLIQEISEHIEFIKNNIIEMTETRKSANSIDDIEERAGIYSEKVRPFLNSVRYHIDKLELIVDDEIWPLPKYRELLFTN
ncbi:MAG: glutamine synthetase III [Bacteroidia bacterium]|nr:glutamine synthetase III [Bacteroidia bacterium]